MDDQLEQAARLGMMLGAAVVIKAVNGLSVYIVQPKSGKLTPDHICVASDLRFAKKQFLVQMPWILTDMNDFCQRNYYEMSKPHQLLCEELWLPDSGILVIPVSK